MTPQIELKPQKELIGQRLKMSYADYKIGSLWGRFMPRRKEIKNTVSNDLIGLTLYTKTHFSHFSPTNEFEKWATIEVSHIDQLPEGLETYSFPGGLYALFQYRGSSKDIAKFYQEIFTVWLPSSEFELDDRPHVEVLGAQYKNNDPSSEEEIWIPIKRP